MKVITRTVWILSLVSLFTDMASEMLYPIMPIYLKSIGFSIVLIGLLEGLAEATAGLSKSYFGKHSDRLGRRVPFVQIGYALSAFSKPLMAVFTFPIWIFFVRTLDRLGKGIRTGARDAILAEESTPETKATVFGFHRSMDTFGAMLGPAMALVYLYFYPQQYKMLFILALFPGIIALIASMLLKEKVKTKTNLTQPISFFSIFSYWKTSSREYRKWSIGFLAFTVFNSSDIFLLLKAKQSGLEDSWIIGIYIFYNFIYALCSYPIGMLADKIGLRNTYLFGLGLFVIVYFGMAFEGNYLWYVFLFVLYGIYAAATEGISKALLSLCAAKTEMANALGSFSGLQSIAALISSSFAGLIWYSCNASVSLIISAIGAFCVIIYFISMHPKIDHDPINQ